ncbi:MAG: hypothetical protein ACO37D_09395, partial [Rhodothermales bacterium]
VVCQFGFGRWNDLLERRKRCFGFFSSTHQSESLCTRWSGNRIGPMSGRLFYGGYGLAFSASFFCPGRTRNCRIRFPRVLGYPS